MIQSTTPLRRHRSGEGWHLHPRRSLGQRAATLVVALVLLVALLVQIARGRLFGLLVVLAVAVAASLLTRPPRTRPRAARHATLDDLTGVLVPMRTRETTTLVYLGLGLLLGAGAVLSLLLALGVLDRNGAIDGVVSEVVAFVLMGGLAGISLAGAYAGLRARFTPDRGLFLTPEAVVLRTRVDPVVMEWSDLAGIRAHWTRRRRSPVPGGPPLVRNWLTFVPSGGHRWPPDPLHAFSGTHQPTAEVTVLATEPAVVRSAIEYYLERPGARVELASSDATRRF